MTKKEDLKFYDPQIDVKKKAIAERLQFFQGHTPLLYQILKENLV